MARSASPVWWDNPAHRRRLRAARSQRHAGRQRRLSSARIATSKLLPRGGLVRAAVSHCYDGIVPEIMGEEKCITRPLRGAETVIPPKNARATIGRLEACRDTEFAFCGALTPR